jgi:hypothetical protein
MARGLIKVHQGWAEVNYQIIRFRSIRLGGDGCRSAGLGGCERGGLVVAVRAEGRVTARRSLTLPKWTKRLGSGPPVRSLSRQIKVPPARNSKFGVRNWGWLEGTLAPPGCCVAFVMINKSGHGSQFSFRGLNCF